MSEASPGDAILEPLSHVVDGLDRLDLPAFKSDRLIPRAAFAAAASASAAMLLARGR